METPYVQANTNGRLHDATTPSLCALDRGFLYGDSVYEVWRTYDGALFAVDEHWTRLSRTADALMLRLPFDAAALRDELLRTAAAFAAHASHVGPIRLRLQVSRGVGPVALEPAAEMAANFVILAQKLRPFSHEKLRRGITLSVARNVRRLPAGTVDPAWKTGNALNPMLALREGRQRGADDVVLLNLARQVTESSTANIFFVRKNAVVTPPLVAGLVAGTTRELLLREIAQRVGVTALEENIGADDLAYFDGCFLSSTTRDLTPVAAIDDTHYAVDDRALVWKLKAAFQNFASDYAAAHPELRIPVAAAPAAGTEAVSGAAAVADR